MDLPSQEDIELELRRRWTLAEFVQAAWHVLEPSTPLVWGWHMQAICDHTQALLAGWLASQGGGPPPAVQNLAVAVPPGSSKSRIVSVMAPAWLWVRATSARLQAISGNPRVALRDSVYCRDLILSDWYQAAFQPTWELKEDQNAKGQFNNTAGGFRKAVGAGARITGDRADVTIVDDPLDAADRHSSVARGGVNDWWDSAAASRVNDPDRSVRIFIAQRLHQDDLTGHVLATEPDAWERLVIPQEWEETQRHTTWIGWTDPRTEPGELMCAARFSAATVARERARLGSAGYAAQHQQRPAPEDGALFKMGWLQRFDLANVSRFDAVVHSWDLRNSRTDKEGTSYVCGLCVGVLGAARYVLDVRRGRWSPMQSEQAIVDAAAAWAKQWGSTRAILVEEKAAGARAIEFLRAQRIGNVLPVNPGTASKTQRAGWVSPVVEAGNLYLPRDGLPWVAPFIDELLAFPFAANDDQVDALTQALEWLASNAAAQPTTLAVTPDNANARRAAAGWQPRERTGGGTWRLG